MAAELVETSKLWGRMVAEIEPEWIEPLAEHLIKNPIPSRVGRNLAGR